VAAAITRMVDLFGRSPEVAQERKTLDGLKGRKKVCVRRSHVDLSGVS